MADHSELPCVCHEHRGECSCEDAKHRRQVTLMRMQGDLARDETRLGWMWSVSVALAVFALVLSML